MENNDNLFEKLKNVPYSERMVLLPQCLRSNKCRATRKEFGILECQECYQKREDDLECPLPTMVSLAYEVGYGDAYIFTGGSGIASFLKNKGLPKAVLGVACESELEESVKKMDQIGIISQVEHLLIDGCSETNLFENPENFEEEWKQILTKFPFDQNYEKE